VTSVDSQPARTATLANVSVARVHAAFAPLEVVRKCGARILKMSLTKMLTSQVQEVFFLADGEHVGRKMKLVDQPYHVWLIGRVPHPTELAPDPGEPGRLQRQQAPSDAGALLEDRH
jgi:hypothetical protein